MGTLTVGTSAGFDMTQLDMDFNGTTTMATSTRLVIDYGGGWSNTFVGNFIYSNGQLVGGTLTGFSENRNGLIFDLSGISVDVNTFRSLAQAGDVTAFERYLGSGNDTIYGAAGNDTMFGFGGNDTIYGGGGNDILYGGEPTNDADTGNDIIDGGTGADMMVGGKGDDIYYVDNVGDNVVEAGGSGNDTIYSSVSYNLLGRFVETLILTGNGNINAVGNTQLNTLVGNSGNNVLRGGLGNDLLTGGAGADIFAFDTALGATNIDRITDFSVVDDTIRLSQSIFGGIAALGTLSTGEFRTGTKALDADDHILYNSATGGLFYDADGNGAGAAVQFARLSAGLALTNADFLIVA